jgi:hypothetical protein
MSMMLIAALAIIWNLVGQRRRPAALGRASFAFLFLNLRQPTKLLCRNYPTARNTHKRFGAAD